MHPQDTRGEHTRAIRAARVRAARAHADLDQSVIGDALGRSVYTIKRLERGVRDVTDAELEVIARVCGVPYSFLLGGFTDEPPDEWEPLTVHAAQQFLGDAVAALMDRMADIERQVSRLSGDELTQQVRSELNREDADNHAGEH